MGVKKWLNQILEILMGERAKSQQETENEKLNVLIKKHEELIPSVQKTSVMVDLYWKCYAYGDELKPHIEFLDGIMLSSTRDIAPSCAENNETIAAEFEVAEEEIKKVKKRYALDDAVSDLKKRQDLFNKSNTTISGLFKAINDNFTCMSITLPEDKKKLVGKEIAAVEVKLEVVGRFKETVAVIEFLDGIMLSSTRDIAPSCVENVDELIERQEKSLVQLDGKRNVVVDLIAKGKVILEHPDKPKFLEGNVKRIQEGWDDTKKKASDRLKLLVDTKEAWVGYAQNNETIAAEFEVAEEEIKKVKKRYALDDAVSDLKKRQDLFNKSNTTISGLFKAINDNFTCMSITLPEDKSSEGENQFSLEKMESTLGELKNIFKEKEKLVENL